MHKLRNWLLTIGKILKAMDNKKAYIYKGLVMSHSHRYFIYTKWCIPHCWQAKIEVRSQALVVPTEVTWSMIVSVFCIAKMDKVDNKSSFTQLKSI